MPLSTGQVLNQRYRIVKLLGQGGFGAVYRAWDVNFQMPCALKENFETSPEAQRQFQREAQILHTLRHPGLPLVKDYFIIPGQGQYLVMDYIDGEDLQSGLSSSGKPFAESQVISWLMQVCEALIYLHSQTPQVIHRDIKPANIKITGRSDTSEGRAVLVDFGIAKVYQPGSPTTQGARAVSPGYAPFEQYGHAPTDARTDLYALGATAYALLTGQAPTESIARMAGAELPAPSSFNPALSPAMEQIILKALAQMPGDRYQSAREFLDDLKQIGVQTLDVKAVEAELAFPGKAQEPAAVQVTAAQVGVAGETGAPAPQAAEAGGAPRRASPKPAIQPPAAYQPTPAARKAGPKKKTGMWLGIGAVVVVLLLVAGGAYAWQAGWLNGVFGEVSFDGMWTGDLYTRDAGTVELSLEIHRSPDDRFFNGVLEARYPDGRFERTPIEGALDGMEFRLRDFRDNESLYLWGSFEGNHLVGLAAWGCYMCDAWGEFRLQH